MGYVDENLISGETVTYRTQLHWLVLVWPSLAAAFFGVAGVFVLIQALFLLGFPLIVLGAIPLIGALIKKSAAEFAVTNKRVILKTGVIRRRTTEMFLSKIESIGVNQSISGASWVMAASSFTELEAPRNPLTWSRILSCSGARFRNRSGR